MHLIHLETHCPKTTETEIGEGHQEAALSLPGAVPAGVGMNCPSTQPIKDIQRYSSELLQYFDSQNIPS